jgi:hypothetical protein
MHIRRFASSFCVETVQTAPQKIHDMAMEVVLLWIGETVNAPHSSSHDLD